MLNEHLLVLEYPIPKPVLGIGTYILSIRTHTRTTTTIPVVNMIILQKLCLYCSKTSGLSY